MAVEPAVGHHRCRISPSFTAVVLLLLFSVSGAFARTAVSGGRFSGGSVKKETGGSGEAAMISFLNRRRLVGPGSSVPTCVSKCGRCRPCRLVKVHTPPGMPTPLAPDYYPQVWRCKCGDKLFKP